MLPVDDILSLQVFLKLLFFRITFFLIKLKSLYAGKGENVKKIFFVKGEFS